MPAPLHLTEDFISILHQWNGRACKSIKTCCNTRTLWILVVVVLGWGVGGLSCGNKARIGFGLLSKQRSSVDTSPRQRHRHPGPRHCAPHPHSSCQNLCCFKNWLQLQLPLDGKGRMIAASLGSPCYISNHMRKVRASRCIIESITDS